MKKRNWKDAIETAGRQGYQGLTFGFGDELIDAPTAAIVAALTKQKFGDVYKEARGISRENIAEDWQKAPVTSLAANVVGGIPFALSKPAQALSNWSRGGNLLQTVGKNAAVGAGYGAASGLGSASSDSDASLREAMLARAGGAAGGAVIGGGIGAVGGALGRFLSPSDEVNYGKVSKQVAKQQPNQAEKYLSEQLAARPDLQAQLARAEAMNTASRNTGIDLTLAEKIAQSQSDPLLAQQKILGGNPQTAGAMEGLYAARSGTSNTSGQIENSLMRQAQEYAPGLGSYDDVAGTLINKADEARAAMNQRLQTKAGPLYDEAYAANQSVDSPAIERILQTPMGREAFKRARVTMQNNMKLLGVSDKELTEQAAESGITTGRGVASGLKLEFLDTLKKEIDAIYKMAERSGDTSAMNSARDLARGLLKELDAADVTAKAGPNSFKPEGGAYAQARAVYSGNPDLLQAREEIGNLADIDPMNAKAVAQQLFSGTQQNAQVSARNLGPQASKMAVSARVYDALDTYKGDPTKLASAISPNSRTSDMLRTYGADDRFSQTLDVINQAKIGEKFRYGSPTNQLGQSENAMAKAAGSALNIVTAGKAGIAQKVLSIFGQSKENNPKFYQDMLNLMTTDEGMNLVRRVANQQGTAVQKQQAMNALVQSVGPRISGSGQALSNAAVMGAFAPMPQQQEMRIQQPQGQPQLPAGFMLEPQLPQGFIIDRRSR